jgi:hypothetical protein
MKIPFGAAPDARRQAADADRRRLGACVLHRLSQRPHFGQDLGIRPLDCRPQSFLHRLPCRPSVIRCQQTLGRAPARDVTVWYSTDSARNRQQDAASSQHLCLSWNVQDLCILIPSPDPPDVCHLRFAVQLEQPECRHGAIAWVPSFRLCLSQIPGNYVCPHGTGQRGRVKMDVPRTWTRTSVPADCA